MMLHPRHRGDCAEFFAHPEYTDRMELNFPKSATSAIEHAAARTGRTWNEQFLYVIDVCRNTRRPDYDDSRSAEDWRTLLSLCRYRFNEADDWRPFPYPWRRTTQNRSQGDA